MLFTVLVHAQNTKGVITGVIRDKESGETLPYANVILEQEDIGTAANQDGYFVIVDVPPGKHKLTVRYIGYSAEIMSVFVKPGSTVRADIELHQETIKGESITVYANAPMMDASHEISRVSISPRQVVSLPNMGEVDVFRTLQLLPGISGASDGSSGLYVRGGTPDQNLILFDGMTIYHVDHFFGFFSAFNADAIKDIQIMKGGFPAEYGGRVSSVVNLTGKTGDMNRFRAGFGLNLLSGHGSCEIPLGEWGNLLIAGRRSYTDFIQSGLYNDIYSMITGDENSGMTGDQPGGGGMRGGMYTSQFVPAFYFYDWNTKLSVKASETDRLVFSFYSGKDNLDNSQDFGDMAFRYETDDANDESGSLSTQDLTTWGNTGLSCAWNRQWSERFHTGFIAAFSQYFSQRDRDTEISGLARFQDDSTTAARGMGLANQEDNLVTDVTAQWNAEWHAARQHRVKFGIKASAVESEYTMAMNDTTVLLNRMDNAGIIAGYIQDRITWGRTGLCLGMRTNFYGPAGKIFWEPRASFEYDILKPLKLKGAWGLYHQFVNRITNEQITQGSRDFWLLADDTMKPIFSRHAILGLQYDAGAYMMSVEGYHKYMDNLAEFTRRFQGRADYENFFFFGEGVSKGVELLIQKQKGWLTGWVGYTLGSVEYTFPNLNSGNPFPASHDRKHELNVVAKAGLGAWSFGATAVFASGQAYTAPESQYYLDMIGGESVSYIHVGEKNSSRLPDYFRLDLSASRHFESDMWRTEVGVSIFNSTNHKNVWYREYQMDTNPVTVTDVVMLGFTPTVYVQFNLK